MKDARLKALTRWSRELDLPSPLPNEAVLKPVSDDASFRRYLRCDPEVAGLIFVDAPPAQEDNHSFVKIAGALNAAGLSCPQVHAVDYEQGFMVLSDFGDRLYQHAIENEPATTQALYDQAVAALLTMISVKCDVPSYSESKLREEMSLFTDWFVAKQLGLNLSDAEISMLTAIFDILIDNALQQPSGFVHRDYHSRNLMIIDHGGPGIIDFQDAVSGPVTYDLVSLFKDCYYRFERKEVVRRVEAFHHSLVAEHLVKESDPFLRWFDLMGAQRHLKCAGIFSRLNLRDAKPGYLPDIPLVIAYLLEVADLYDEFQAFGNWLRKVVLPRLSESAFQRERS